MSFLPPHFFRVTDSNPRAVALALSLSLCGVARTSSAQPPNPPAPVEKTDTPTTGEIAPETPIDVQVEGSKSAAPRASRDPSVASYVIRGEPLRRPGATAVDAVAPSPGVQVARSGAGSDLATVSIRGAPSASLPVYLAGVRLNDDVTGGADLSTLPLFALDRIEVYRGNAPPDADRLGIGGALFFEPRLPRGTHAGATLGAGSFGELTAGAFASAGTDRAAALFSVSTQRAANDFTFTDERGTASPDDDRQVTRENGDCVTYDAWSVARLDLPRGARLLLLTGAFAREQGVTGTSTIPARFARSATQRELAALSARLPCTDDASTCSVELSASGILSSRLITDPKFELGFLADRVEIAAQRWQESLRVRARPTDHLRLGGALFTGIDRLTLSSSGTSSARAARLAVTATLDAAWQLTPRVEVFGVLAGECHSALEAEGSTPS
ncbi:MAG: TonB-dependent receptor [Polyangiaceae bacterium]